MGTIGYGKDQNAAVNAKYTMRNSLPSGYTAFSFENPDGTWRVDYGKKTGSYKVDTGNDAGYEFKRGGELSSSGSGSGGSTEDRFAAAQAEANSIAQEQVGISRQMADIAQARYDYQKENFEPFEQDLINLAKAGYDPVYAAELASNRVESGMNAAQGAFERQQQRMGISGDDPRYQSIEDNLQLAKQAAIAGARNNARLRTADANRNMELSIAGMGRGVPASSLGAFSGAAQSLNQAAQSNQSGMGGLASAMFTGSGIGQSNALQAGRMGLASYQMGLDASQFQQRVQMNNSIMDARANQALYGAIGSGIRTGVTMYGMRDGGATNPYSGQLTSAPGVSTSGISNMSGPGMYVTQNSGSDPWMMKGFR